jgi:hypothetical protein
MVLKNLKIKEDNLGIKDKIRPKLSIELQKNPFLL